MSDIAVAVNALHKSYRLDKVTLNVLRGVSFTIRQGEFVAVVGASGCGKSTLLHLLGLLDRPDQGQISLHGVDVSALASAARNRMRCREIGFVFQFYHLLPDLSVLENVLLPAKVDSPMTAWLGRRSALRKTAQETLVRLGLGERLSHRPKELSGGERQRVAIARALMNRPRLLLADEPTGNLDSKTGSAILDVIKEFHKEFRQTVVMVTHDASLASQADRIVHMRDGRLSEK